MVNIIHKLSLIAVFMNYKMLEYDRIDLSEGIDINKTSASKECDICHYWYFLNIKTLVMNHIFAMVVMI